MSNDTPDDEPNVNEAVVLAKSIHPLLEGKPAPVVAAALADLVSLLIAGHTGDTDHATKRVREMILEEHVKAVKRLIPLQDAMIRARMTPPTQGRSN